MSIIGAQACSRELPAQDKQGWLCVTVNILFPRADSPLGHARATTLHNWRCISLVERSRVLSPSLIRIEVRSQFFFRYIAKSMIKNCFGCSFIKFCVPRNSQSLLFIINQASQFDVASSLTYEEKTERRKDRYKIISGENLQFWHAVSQKVQNLRGLSARIRIPVQDFHLRGARQVLLRCYSRVRPA